MKPQILTVLLMFFSLHLLWGQTREKNCYQNFWNCFDADLWKKDSNACNHDRIFLYTDIILHKECIFVLDTSQLYTLLGTPSFQVDWGGNNTYICYWIECAPNLIKNTKNVNLSELCFRDIRHIEFWYNKKERKITDIHAGIP